MFNDRPVYDDAYFRKDFGFNYSISSIFADRASADDSYYGNYSDDMMDSSCISINDFCCSAASGF